jgi:hypothetical protein
MNNEPTDLWAIVEVMGHARYAGRVSEYSELGVPLVRVEVPAVNGEPGFEKLLGPRPFSELPHATSKRRRRRRGNSACDRWRSCICRAWSRRRVSGPTTWSKTTHEHKSVIENQDGPKTGES